MALPAQTIRAQEPPPPPAPTEDPRAVIEAVESVSDAFDAIALRAADGEWQAADAAYNAALDALDAARPVLLARRGPAAEAALAEVEARLPAIVDALDAEDSVALRVEAGAIEAALAPLAPGVVADAPSEAAVEIIREWQAGRADMLRLAAAGQWRDMRDAGSALRDDIAARGPTVVAAVPEADAEAAQEAVEVARVLAARMRAAALSQDGGHAEAAAEHYDAALERLLRLVGALPVPTPTPERDVRMRFRAFQVTGAVGERVIVPVVADDIPQIGLGAFELRARWSPQALRLIDVAWDVAAGSVVRDDPAGIVTLTFPQAPTGPSGDQVLLRLSFEVRSGRAEPRHYLPRATLTRVEDAIATAEEEIRLGNVPQAADALAAAYLALLDGRGVPDSAYTRLARTELADPLTDGLRAAVDVTTAGAETDLLVVVLADLETRLAATLSAYGQHIGTDAGIPIVLEVESVTDTRGQPLPVLEPGHGLIMLGDAVVPTALPGIPVTPTVAGAELTPPPPPTGDTLPPAVTTGLPPVGEGAADGQSAPADGDGDGASLPLPLLAALVAALLLGVLATMRGTGSADGGGG